MTDEIKLTQSTHAFLLAVAAIEELRGWTFEKSWAGSGRYDFFAKERGETGHPKRLFGGTPGVYPALRQNLTDAAHMDLRNAGLIKEGPPVRIGHAAKKKLWKVSAAGRAYVEANPKLKHWKPEETTVAAEAVAKALVGRLDDWVSIGQIEGGYKAMVVDDVKPSGVTMAGMKRGLRQGVLDGKIRFKDTHGWGSGLKSGQHAFSIEEDAVAEIQKDARAKANAQAEYRKACDQRKREIARLFWVFLIGEERTAELDGREFAYGSVSLSFNGVLEAAEFHGLELPAEIQKPEILQ